MSQRHRWEPSADAGRDPLTGLRWFHSGPAYKCRCGLSKYRPGYGGRVQYRREGQKFGSPTAGDCPFDPASLDCEGPGAGASWPVNAAFFAALLPPDVDDGNTGREKWTCAAGGGVVVPPPGRAARR